MALIADEDGFLDLFSDDLPVPVVPKWDYDWDDEVEAVDSIEEDWEAWGEMINTEGRRGADEEAAKKEERIAWWKEKEEESIAWWKERRRWMEEEHPLFEYEPKRGCHVFTRFCFAHGILPISQLDEETQAGPMSLTNATHVGDLLDQSGSANIFSVKIVESDVGYPINLYGTVIARDALDFKCIYIFRRDRENCQLINSKDESLTLTGPSRGLLLNDYLYFETNLKIKDDQHSEDREFRKGLLELENLKINDDKHSEDREFSKGLLYLHGIRCVHDKVASITLPSKLSTVELTYVAVSNAVEGTVEIKFLNKLAAFEGKITARTTSIRDDFLLYDSKKGSGTTVNDDGTIQLLRRVVAVSTKDMLEFYIDVYDGDNINSRMIYFTPQLKGASVYEFVCGVYKMEAMVTWSTLM